MNLEHLERVEEVSERPRREWRWDSSRFQSFDLRELLGALRRRIWLILACFVLITGAAIFIVNRITPLYEATSSVMIDVNERSLADVQSIVTGLPAASETIQSQVAVILSRDFSERVIRQLRLYEEPEFNPSLREASGWQEAKAAVRRFVSGLLPTSSAPQPADVPSVEEQADQERVRIINALLRKLEIVPRAGTWVIDITASSESPVIAARLANTIAEIYLVDQLEAKFEATKRSTEWLTDRLSTLRADVENAERAVETYRSAAGLLQGGDDATLAQQQISNVNTQLVTARIRRAEVEARLRQAESLLRSPEGAGTSADVLQSPLIQNLLAQETEVLRRIAELSSTVGENFPEMVAARAEARDLRAKITDEIGRVVQSLRNEAAVARAQESAFEQSLAELEAKVSGLNSKGAELRVLEREAEANQLLYETFLSRFKESQGEEEIQQSDARVISRADVPVSPASPNKPILVALAGAFSLLLGFSMVLILEQSDRGVHSMEEVYRYLDLPCLGLVPAISNLRLAAKSPEDYVVRKPTSAYAEAVRSIRTGLLLSDPDASPRVMVVTSARPNEGKTAIAISAARLNAMGGRRTILVDLDLRKPEIHRRLRARSEIGVIDYLAGQAKLEDVVQKDEACGLEYIVAGQRIANFAELLRSNHLEQLFRELRQQYDLVILDAPPVLAVADTRLISRIADKTLFVVRWGETPRDVARLALRQLVDAGADIAGVALSIVDVRRNARYAFGDSEVFTGAYRRYYAN